MLLRLEEPARLAGGDRLSIVTGERPRLVCKARVARQVTRDSYEVTIEGELKGKIGHGCRAYLQPPLPGVAEALAAARSMEAPAQILDAAAVGRVGGPLRVAFTVAGRRAEIESEGDLLPATQHALDSETMRRALGRLGGTGYELGQLDLSGLEGDLFLPVSQLNEMRRRAVELLGSGQPAERPRRRASPGPKLDELPRFGVVLSDPEQAAAFRELGAEVFLEITRGEVDFDPALCIPTFPAVLFDHQLHGCREVIRRPGIRAVVSSNVGLGAECAQTGVPWIAGPHVNVCNALAARALQEGGAAAFFHSPEADVAQLGELALPEGMQSLLTVAGPMLVMTTRQCIVRNLEGCTRLAVDRDCVAECARSALMRDDGGRPFFVEKRRGTHNEIYNGSILWYPRAVRLFVGRIGCFVLDLRDLSFLSLSLADKLDMLRRVERAAEGGEDDAGAGSRLGSITRGGFARGL
jgi:putative protease